tara:strand:+ start:1783 stop:1989 length:207 start_codon:yes stop_codon:yes gene_type:complete
MNLKKSEIVETLAIKAIEIAGESRKEIERCCWIVVHEHHHGVRPSEYDIREIDENLYLAILKRVRELN